MPVVTVNIDSLTEFADSVEKAAESLAPSMRESVFDIGKDILKKAGELAAFSGKIPDTLRVVMLSGPSVMVTAGNERTPTAYMFEIGKTAAGNVWNHPVFPGAGEARANWHWHKMTRPRRPFLTPAVIDVGIPAANGLGDEIVDEINKTLGAK